MAFERKHPMCYMLYGAVNKEISPADYQKLSSFTRFSIRPGTKQALGLSIERDEADFRLTTRPCDCDSPFGTGKADAEELIELSRQIHALRSARNAKCVWLCKTWAGTRNKSEETVHIDDVDLPRFLAAAETDCLYRIDLYQRYGTGGSK